MKNSLINGSFETAKKENTKTSNERISKVEEELRELKLISQEQTDKWKLSKRILEEEQNI